MTQPAEQTDFRYFRDADGSRWKMPTDNSRGYYWSNARGGWIDQPTNLSGLLLDVEEDGTIETDATGAPLAKGEKSFDWSGKTTEEQTALDEMNAPAPAAPGGEHKCPASDHPECKSGCRYSLETGAHPHRVCPEGECDLNAREAVEPSPPAGGGELIPRHDMPEWMLAHEYEWFRTGWSYASTQTYAIPAMAKISPVEAFHLMEAIKRGPSLMPAPPPAATPGDAIPQFGPRTDAVAVRLLNAEGSFEWRCGELLKWAYELERESAGLREALRAHLDAKESLEELEKWVAKAPEMDMSLWHRTFTGLQSDYNALLNKADALTAAAIATTTDESS